MYKKNYRRVLAVTAAVLILGIIYLVNRRMNMKEERVVLLSTGSAVSEENAGEGETQSPESTDICVFITGCVKSPGVYTVPEGTRIHEVLALAGGFSEDADTGAVNLAEALYDGEAVRIPGKNEEYGETAAPSDGRVDLNTADKEQLMTLPGIGEAKAEAILSYRKTHGRFSSVDDLLGVSGIGEGILSRIRDKIRI
ncbi:MAG: ComEA family DNA-binding protein [Lachnospiraceae bacterium]|nr:ComEA family DNA-binding protein [Lachnospiraceae bacterium]